MKIKVLFILVLLSASAFSQSSKKTEYSLDDCIRIAYEHNTEIQSAKAQLEVDKASKKSAVGDYLPSINASMGYQHQYGGKFSNNNGILIEIPDGQFHPESFSLSAQAQLVLFNGFARGANYSAVQSISDANNYYYDFSKYKIKFNIINKYLEVIKKKQIVDVRKQSFEQALMELDRLKARYQAGISEISTVYSQEAELGNLELNVVNAEYDVKLAKSELLNTMGIEADLSIEFSDLSKFSNISDKIISDFRNQIGNYTSIIEQALSGRSDYNATKNNIETAKYNITAAKSGYYPSLTGFAGLNWNNYIFDFNEFNKTNSTYIGLNLSIPIFENFKSNEKIENARLALLKQEIEQKNLELTIRANIQTSILLLESAEKQLDITSRTLKSAERNFEIAKEKFRVGNANVIEYNEANRQFITAQINNVGAIYNYYQVQKQVLYNIGREL